MFNVWGLGGAASGGDTSYTDNVGDEFNFANSGAAVNANGDVLLGKVTISGNATPEPSSLVLFAVAGLGLAVTWGRRIIRRRNARTAY